MIATLSYLSPALFLWLGAFLLCVAPKGLKQGIWLLIPVLTLIVVLFAAQSHPAVAVLGFTLLPQLHDNISHGMSLVLTAMLIVGALYAISQQSTAEKVAVFLYAGSALGVVYAADWLSLFFFWEIMAIASTIVIWSVAGTEALQAGFRYLLFHLTGGVLLLAGIAGEFTAIGQIQMGHLSLASLSSWLILLGLLVNAGAFPLGAWLPDAYPQASWSGSVFLSMFTTKVAIYILLRLFAGTELLIWIGLATAVHGLIYALLQNDFRRFLSYMLLSQLGIMMCGIGLGSATAQQGVIAHALASIVYMAVLFMVAGNNVKDIQESAGGLSQSWMSWVSAIFGGAALAALPMTLGFVSKSLIIDAAAEVNLTVWAALIGISIGTGVAVCGMLDFLWKIKQPFKKGGSGMLFMIRQGSLILPVAVILGGGIAPSIVYRLWTKDFSYNPYTVSHLVQQGIILVAAILVFYLARRLFPHALKRPPADIDYLWRYWGADVSRWGVEKSNRVAVKLENRLRAMSKIILGNLSRRYDQGGAGRRSWSTAISGMWVLVVLGIYLIIYLIPGH